MTQKEFASLMGVSESALGKYECGVRRPKDDFRINLSVYTGKTVEELFYKQEKRDMNVSLKHKKMKGISVNITMEQ